MEHASDTLGRWFDNILGYARDGFTDVNLALGLIIAFVAAVFFVRKYTTIFVVAIGATAAHLVIEALLPVLSQNAAFKLPPNMLEQPFWELQLGRYIAYLIVIAVFFTIRRTMLKSSAAAH